MKQSIELSITILGLSLLLLPDVQGQDRYPKPLPKVDITQVSKSSTVPEHELKYDTVVGDIINQTNLDSLISYVRILSGEDSTWINGSKVRIQNRASNHVNNETGGQCVLRRCQQCEEEPQRRANSRRPVQHLCGVLNLVEPVNRRAD